MLGTAVSRGNRGAAEHPGTGVGRPYVGRGTKVCVGATAAVWMLLLCGGCAGPSPASPGRQVPAVNSAPASGSSGVAQQEDLSLWVTRALDGAGNDAIAVAVRGRETAYFLELLQRVAKEARDVGSVVRGAARQLAVEGGTPGAAIVVRELWARECCMRRGFLAEGLRGLVDGLEARAAEPVQEAGTALSLEELAAHADTEVANAARAALAYFTVEAPGI